MREFVRMENICSNMNAYVQNVIKGIVLIAAVGFDCVSKSKSDVKLKDSDKNKDSVLA